MKQEDNISIIFNYLLKLSVGIDINSVLVLFLHIVNSFPIMDDAWPYYFEI